jgi:predicted DNA binding CopG/RHH family protein
MKKKIPQFKSEKEEREFWQTHDSTEYVDWKKAKKVKLANLKPSVKTISLRLPEAMLEDLKLLANKRDVPYQSLVKVFLSDRIEQEFTTKQKHSKSLQRIDRKSAPR